MAKISSYPFGIGKIEFVKAIETKARQEREHLYGITSKMNVDANPEIAFALFLGMVMEQKKEQKVTP